MVEEEEFNKTVPVEHISALPRKINVISSNTISRIMVEDDSSLKLKSRIFPHGYEDSINSELKSCNMYFPSG